MRVVKIIDQTVPISRYADPAIPSGNLTTTMVAVVTDVYRDGKPVVGYGFSSIGRFGQSGLIRERFAPRLLAAGGDALLNAEGDNIDPFRAWDCMMKDEKPGGHGERCIAVGTLDMALWDAAAKIAGQPLYRFLAERTQSQASANVPVYAGGGYYFPSDDLACLADEIKRFLDGGYSHVKIKIGAMRLTDDLKRIDTVLALLPGASYLAVDAMNRYTAATVIPVARALASYHLRWFEDMCDPLDYETHARIAEMYESPLAVGEAIFSVADTQNLIRYARLRPDCDVLLFDPAHCYGLPEYLRILESVEKAGWSRASIHPHGGHLFTLHVAAGLGLGGSEANPHNFQPFGGFADGAAVKNGVICPPDAPGIGFETRASLIKSFHALLETA